MASSFFHSKICFHSACQKLEALHATGRCRMQSLHATGSQSHIDCTREPASRMQIVPTRPPVPCNINEISHAGTICMRLAATWVQFACIWRPLGYNLHATGSHLGTIYKQLANLAWDSGPLRAKPLVFCKHAARKFFELKNENSIKKSENLHSGTICMRLAATRLQDKRQADKKVV